MTISDQAQQTLRFEGVRFGVLLRKDYYYIFVDDNGVTSKLFTSSQIEKYVEAKQSEAQQRMALFEAWLKERAENRGDVS